MQLTLRQFAERAVAPNPLWASTWLHITSLESGIGLLLPPEGRGRTYGGAIWALYRDCTHPEVLNPSGKSGSGAARIVTEMVRRRAVASGALQLMPLAARADTL